MWHWYQVLNMSNWITAASAKHRNWSGCRSENILFLHRVIIHAQDTNKPPHKSSPKLSISSDAVEPPRETRETTTPYRFVITTMPDHTLTLNYQRTNGWKSLKIMRGNPKNTLANWGSRFIWRYIWGSKHNNKASTPCPAMISTNLRRLDRQLLIVAVLMDPISRSLGTERRPGRRKKIHVTSSKKAWRTFWLQKTWLCQNKCTSINQLIKYII